MFTVYTPHGHQTEVSIFAAMEVAGVPPTQLDAMARGAWETACNEDDVGIRAFHKGAK